MSHIFYFSPFCNFTWEIYTILNTRQSSCFYYKVQKYRSYKKELSEKRSNVFIFRYGLFFVAISRDNYFSMADFFFCFPIQSNAKTIHDN